MDGIEIEIEKGGKDYVEMRPPEGLMLPEGLEEDGTFDLTTTWRMKPDGKMCVVAVDGVPVPEKEEMVEEEMTTDMYEPREDAFMKGMDEVAKKLPRMM